MFQVLKSTGQKLFGNTKTFWGAFKKKYKNMKVIDDNKNE